MPTLDEQSAIDMMARFNEGLVKLDARIANFTARKLPQRRIAELQTARAELVNTIATLTAALEAP